ncbi:terminase large subunit domain-containing protein [Sinorhizobium meliloti]|uniref:terminase large subunit domain-containing protein n=1 Tax=Rhizobium meliloti TaxID=382 RepID=UPI003D64858E
MTRAEPGQGAQTIIRPQPGPQTAFLVSPADIAIYGGSAGGGKTWALLMEPLRHIANPQFGAVFRRSTVQVRNEGGSGMRARSSIRPSVHRPKEHVLQWSFPSGGFGIVAHLEHDKTVLNWQGLADPAHLLR